MGLILSLGRVARSAPLLFDVAPHIFASPPALRHTRVERACDMLREVALFRGFASESYAFVTTHQLADAAGLIRETQRRTPRRDVAA